MVNTEYLLGAAERIRDQYHEDSSTVDPELAFDLAEHILATVRDDDDEPVSEEWFKSIGMQWEEADKCFFLRNHIGITSFHGGFWFFDYEDGPGWEIKTRGQFRRLCEGLGIQLKEAT